NFAAGFIGVAARDQLLDQRHHVGFAVSSRQYEIGGARLDGWTQAAERINIVVELIGGLLGDFPDRLVQRQTGKIPRGAIVDLVVDVGDVADVSDVVLAIEMPQQTKQHV